MQATQDSKQSLKMRELLKQGKSSWAK